MVNWNFPADAPDYPFTDWNFSATTAEDCAWLCECVKTKGKDIYVDDFTEQGADMEGSKMRHTLLAAYDKLFAGAVA